jgi:hypothetical protein
MEAYNAARWGPRLRDGRGRVADADGLIGDVVEYRRTIRVMFRDGPVGDAEERIPLHGVQQLVDRKTIDCWPELAERTKIGASVPVRYDESNHSHIVLDLPALIEELLSEPDRSADA